MKTPVSFFFLFLSMVLSIQAQENDEPKKININRSWLASERPELTADLSKIAEARIFVSKSVYRLEELMALDLGLLFTDKSAYFFRENIAYRLVMKDEAGRSIYLKSLFSVDHNASYIKVEEMMVKKNSLIIVGCENRSIKDIEIHFKELVEVDKWRPIFEKDMYRTPINNCIDVSKPTELEIYAEIYNDRVVQSNVKEKIKTAVGTIRSNVLKIRIEK